MVSVIMLAREVLIAAATIGLALAGARRIDVVWAGKAGTLLALMFSLPMFLGADATRASWHAFFIVCAWGSRSAASSSATTPQPSTSRRRVTRSGRVDHLEMSWRSVDEGSDPGRR